MCDHCIVETALFERSGSPAPAGVAIITEKKTTFYTRPKLCTRCGGAGGSDAWNKTGWKCYKCEGHRYVGIEKVKLYTTADLDRLNAQQDKRAAKKRLEVAAKQQAEAEAAELRRVGFLQAHGDLIARAKVFADRSEFIGDIVAKGMKSFTLTDNQIAALTTAVARLEADTAKRAAAGYIGTIGGRERGITAIVTFSYQLPRFRYNDAARFITVMETEDGNFIQVKSAAFAPVKGSKVLFDGTVKAHTMYRNTKQTIMQRLDVKACIKPKESVEA